MALSIRHIDFNARHERARHFNELCLMVQDLLCNLKVSTLVDGITFSNNWGAMFLSCFLT